MSNEGLSPEPPSRQAVAEALLEMASRIEEAAHSVDEARLAAVAYGYVIEACEGSLENSVRLVVARALLHRGSVIAGRCADSGDMEDLPEALASFDRVFEEYARDPDPDLRYWAADACWKGAVNSLSCGLQSEGARYFQQVVDSFWEDPDPRVREMATSVQSIADLASLKRDETPPANGATSDKPRWFGKG
jgi:hypothetical protein